MRGSCLTVVAIGTVCLLFAALPGCGGGENTEPLDPPPRSERGTVVAALGDSITAGSPLWDPDEAVISRIGSAADPRSQYEYWAQRRLPNAEFRNCGVFGERTDQIAERLEGCARDAEVLIVQGGINDIAQMRRVKPAARNLRAMVARGKELGLRVALVEVLPWNDGGPVAAPRIRRLNRLIAAIGSDEDVPIFGWYDRLEDPSSPGRMKAEWTIDGNHPSVAGYRRLADTVELP